jgi:hypothetical protein
MSTKSAWKKGKKIMVPKTREEMILDELEETRQVARNSIDQFLGRGESLLTLDKTVQNLVVEAADFRVHATNLREGAQGMSRRTKVVIAVSVLIGLTLIALIMAMSVCGVDFTTCPR